MTDDDLYINLPDDNELAFLQLEEIFRADLEEKTENPNAGPLAYMEYVNKITAVARAFKAPVLVEFSDIKTMQIGNATNFYSQMSPIIDNYIIQIKIRHGRRVKGYSVALDAVTKEKVRHLIGQIKSIVDRLDVNIQKREALYSKIMALSDEVDRDRTRYDAYAALAIEMSNTAGKVARNLRPAGGLLDRIGKFFGMAKDAEATKPQLQLEAPRLQLAPPDEADTAAGEQD